MPKIIEFHNTYANLPGRFYRRVLPTAVKRPTLLVFNSQLAAELRLKTRDVEASTLAQIFSGNELPEGADSLAMAYAGHQFGHFVPELGDGRAILLGEVIDPNGRCFDIHLKGSGRTPFSRSGDGRAAIGPVIREYIISEAMHQLGIPTTRSLAIVKTGETVQRDHIMSGAILTRVARSHIRIGTFEYFNARGDVGALKILADYVINRLYPEVQEAENPYSSLLEIIIQKQALLIASWMQVGFIHGVMNTDNVALSGETIDYGPCAFIDAYDPNKVFSSIDHYGRYAFINQPIIGLWNLTRFAETLLSLIATDIKKSTVIAQDLLAEFQSRFENVWLEKMRQKIGLTTNDVDDKVLIDSLLALMHVKQMDYTLTFRQLAMVIGNVNALPKLSLSKEFNAWILRWQQRLNQQPQTLLEISQSMDMINPLYIPRNHRIQEVIVAAEAGDYLPMQKLINVLSKPYKDTKDFQAYENPPLPHEEVTQTFCGT